MPSVFDDLFDGAGVTSLFEYHGDENQLVTYHPPGAAATTADIVAMIGHEQVIEVEGIDGTIRKEHRRQIAVTTDSGSTWKGISDPQLRGRIEMLNYFWSIEDRDALSVEGRSEQLVSLSLVRKEPTSKSYERFKQH
jgi:hypothetical protein